MQNYKLVIGLEIHVELNTKSKMFCQCSSDYFGKESNTNTCPVCLGMPGALPVPNRKALEYIIKIGKALNCTINRKSKFDRKHYFYPDLSKGYQISQYDEPVAVKGALVVINPKTGKEKTFQITRVHMEEDTGKLLHAQNETLVDFNRCGVPLVEIVTEPDFDNAEDVKMFLEELYTIIETLDVSDADMEKGSMRLEPNISVKVATQTELPNYKVEVKNINSFNFVKKAIEYEFERQSQLLEKGESPSQETRGYDDKKGVTYSQRVKVDAHDYRYFPEPDIPPMNFDESYIDSIVLPKLPYQRLKEYLEKGIKITDAFIITRDVKVSQKFDEYCKEILNRLKGKSTPNDIYQKTANFFINKVGQSIDSLLESLMPKTTDTDVLESSVQMVLEQNAKAVQEYKSGKLNVVMFLVGQVMKEMKGQADATVVKTKLEERLK